MNNNTINNNQILNSNANHKSLITSIPINNRIGQLATTLGSENNYITLAKPGKINSINNESLNLSSENISSTLFKNENIFLVIETIKQILFDEFNITSEQFDYTYKNKYKELNDKLDSINILNELSKYN